MIEITNITFANDIFILAYRILDVTKNSALVKLLKNKKN